MGIRSNVVRSSGRRLAVVAAVGGLLVGGAVALAPWASAANPHVHFVDGGTASPASTIGGYVMTPFAADSRGADGTDIGTTVTAPNGTVTFSHSMYHYVVSELNGGWGNGYSGDVYVPNDTATGTITMTLPADTTAFEFYGLSNESGTFTITAQTSDGTSSGAIAVTTDTLGSNAAHGFAFYTDDGSAITSVTATLQSTSIDGILLGEFSVSYPYSTELTNVRGSQSSVLLPPTFTAQLTSPLAAPTGLAGETITFTAGSVTICSATTNAHGVATCSPSTSRQSAVSQAITANHNQFTASFAGDNGYLPSSVTKRMSNAT